MNMNYKIIDRKTYYRKDVFRHFTEDNKCSASMTARIDVTGLAAFSKSDYLRGLPFRVFISTVKPAAE